MKLLVTVNECRHTLRAASWGDFPVAGWWVGLNAWMPWPRLCYFQGGCVVRKPTSSLDCSVLSENAEMKLMF